MHICQHCCSLTHAAFTGGVLNFVDGLRSACGDQRIFIFTTNFPEVTKTACSVRLSLQVCVAHCMPCSSLSLHVGST